MIEKSGEVQSKNSKYNIYSMVAMATWHKWLLQTDRPLNRLMWVYCRSCPRASHTTADLAIHPPPFHVIPGLLPQRYTLVEPAMVESIAEKIDQPGSSTCHSSGLSIPYQWTHANLLFANFESSSKLEILDEAIQTYWQSIECPVSMMGIQSRI